MLARRLGFPQEVQRAVRFTLEQWDGRGLVYGMTGEQIPITSRIVHMAQVLEVAHRLGGVSMALAMAKQRRGKDFDPILVDAFLGISTLGDFWEPLRMDVAQHTILAMKPPSPFDHLSESEVDTFCEVVADFNDIRSPHTWNHSQIVATVAVQTGRHLGLSQEELRTLRRAGLVHDLGKAALPLGIVEKEGNLSESEWERFRLHPYYTERILSRVERLKPLMSEAAAHHERIDGEGYHRRLAGEQIPLGGRILSTADVYAIFSKRAEGEDPQATLQQMQSLVGTQLDSDCYDALVASFGDEKPVLKRQAVGQPPHTLSEREMEVLRELAKGFSNKQIAKSLFISEKTVERHLENIYGKLDVSCRTAAVVWAVQNGIAS